MQKVNEYYLKNKEKILQQRKEYYLENKIKILAKAKESYINKYNMIQSYNNKYWCENKATIQAKRQQNYALRDYFKEYYIKTKKYNNKPKNKRQHKIINVIIRNDNNFVSFM